MMTETGGQEVAASVTGALMKTIQGGNPVTLLTKEMTTTDHQAPPLHTIDLPGTEMEVTTRGGMRRTMTMMTNKSD